MISATLLALVIAGGLADDEAFQDGLRLYREVEFEQALFRFQEAATVPDRPDADRVVVFSWLGMTYSTLEHDEASDRAFRDALRIDIAAALPADAAPKLHERFDEIRAQVRAEAAAVTVEPPVVEPPPAEPPPPPPRAPTATPWFFAGAGLAGAAAVVAGTAGGLAVALAFPSVAIAEDESEFQDDRIAALDQANTQFGIGYGLFAAGATMVVVAGGLVGAAFLVE